MNADSERLENKPASGVSAVVLAAGLSTRMGAVKALVPVGGKPMLEHVLAALRQSQVDEIIVVLGHSAEQIQQTVSFQNARVVINDAYREGLSTSLRAGLASIDPAARAALIVLADQPFLKPETIDRLIAEYRSKQPEIVLPLYNGIRGNPVLLDRSVFAEVFTLTGDVGFRAIFGTHTRAILKVDVEDPGVLVDLDTREDIALFE